MPGSAAVVKAGKVPIRGGESQALVLAGGQFLRFAKGNKYLSGFSQRAAGTAGVQLYHLFAGQRAGVLHLHLHGDRLVFCFCFCHFAGKVRVRQTVTKGVQHPLRRKGLKVPIAHKNIFCIAVLCFVAKVLCRVVGVGFGDGVRQATAWVHLPGEHIRHRVTAFHAQLPGQQNGADLVAVGVDFRKVHNAADIQHQHHFLKGGGHCVQQGLFFIRQVKAAFFQRVFPVLTGAAANHHHGGLAPLSSRLYPVLLHRHFCIIAGPVPPKSRVRVVDRGGAPAFIGGQYGAVQLRTGVYQPLHQVDTVRGGNIAAAAVAYIKIVLLHPAEQRHRRRQIQGQGVVVVLQQHAAFRTGPSGQRRHLRIARFTGDPSALLLRQLRPAKGLQHFAHRLISPVGHNRTSIMKIYAHHSKFRRELQ